MKTKIAVPSYLIASTMFKLLAAPSRLHAQSTAGQSSERSIRPALINTCVITEDVERLVGFYEPILGGRQNGPVMITQNSQPSVGVLAIVSFYAQVQYIPRSAEAAKNRSIILEFKVADVDGEYKRLKSLVKTWVKPPTTQPRGTRSIYFRDPDGNLIDFYSPVPAS